MAIARSGQAGDCGLSNLFCLCKIAFHHKEADVVEQETGERGLSKKEDPWQKQFFRHLGHWSWMHILYQYDETHLLIADPFFIDHLHGARPAPLRCKTATAEDYKSVLSDSVKKVLVFLTRGEVALVRRLRREHPDLKVTSGTYGYALTGRDRYPRLKEYMPSSGQVGQAPTILLSTAYADAEFVAKVMEENGLPYVHEHLGRPFASWLQRCEDFQLSRFYEAAARHYGGKDGLWTLLQTDVLREVFENSSCKVRHFIRFLNQSGARVIFVTRRDHFAQATRWQLVNRSTERSVWTKKPAQKMVCKFLGDDFGGCLQRQSQIRDDEKLLAQIQAGCEQSHSLVLEDFVENQADHMMAMSQFLNLALPDTVKTVDYQAVFETAPMVLPAAETYRAELIDRIGLHANSLL